MTLTVTPPAQWTFASPAYADVEADHGHSPPEGHSGPVPMGLALAEAVAEALVQGGCEVPWRWVLHAGHGMEVRVGSGRYDLTVGVTDDEAGRFVAKTEPRRGLFAGLRRGLPPTWPELLERVDGALRAMPGLVDVDGPSGGPSNPADG